MIFTAIMIAFSAATLQSVEVTKDGKPVPGATVSSAATNRQMQSCERANLGISLGREGLALSEAVKYFDNYQPEVEALLNQHAAGKWKVNARNYTMNSGHRYQAAPTQQYNVNLTLTINLNEGVKITPLLEALDAKGYRVNYSLNTYQSYQCQH